MFYIYSIIRVTYVKIHGMKYCSQAVVRVKNVTSDEYEPFVYCKIKNVYVYNDAKIFEVEVMKIVLYHDNIRAIQVTTTNQTLWCLYTDLYIFSWDITLKKKSRKCVCYRQTVLDLSLLVNVYIIMYATVHVLH